MTTEDDFQNALDAGPDDHHTRLVFADWLQDRDDPRADGYRALGLMRKHAYRGEFGGRASWHFLSMPPNLEPAPGAGHDVLPGDWLGLMRPHSEDGEGCRYYPAAVRPNDRRGVEDAAALAFVKLPAERRVELLAAGSAVQRG